MPDWLYQIVYGITRGIAAAWFDEQRERTTYVDERPSADDHALGDRLCAAWVRANAIRGGGSVGPSSPVQVG